MLFDGNRPLYAYEVEELGELGYPGESYVKKAKAVYHKVAGAAKDVKSAYNAVTGTSKPAKKSKPKAEPKASAGAAPKKTRTLKREQATVRVAVADVVPTPAVLKSGPNWKLVGGIAAGFVVVSGAILFTSRSKLATA